MYLAQKHFPPDYNPDDQDEDVKLEDVGTITRRSVNVPNIPNTKHFATDDN